MLALGWGTTVLVCIAHQAYAHHCFSVPTRAKREQGSMCTCFSGLCPGTPLLISHWPKEVTEPSPNSKGAGINFIACRRKQQSHTAKSHAYNDGWYYRSRQPTTTFFSIHTCFFSCRFCLREWCQCPIHSSQSHSSLLLPHLQILQVWRLNLSNATTF